jgi:trypsin
MLAAAAAALIVVDGEPVGAQEVVIQPGVSITMDGSFCTLNWIYDGTGPNAGRVFGGTAAHCVSGVGQDVSLTTGTLGEPTVTFGDVAYVDDNLDYAFIEIRPELVGAVNPAMKGHPELPTGVSTTQTANEGDLIQFSGQGVGFHLLPATQEGRVGVLNYNDGTQHYVTGAVTPGDSGGPVGDITDGNKALGIVNTVGVGAEPEALTVITAGEGGVSLEGMLSDAAAGGFPVALRTVG